MKLQKHRADPLVIGILVALSSALVACKSNNISANGPDCTLRLSAAPCPPDTAPNAVVDCPDGGNCVALGGCTFQCSPKKCAPEGTTQCAGPTVVQTCQDGAWVTQLDCMTKNSTCAVASGGVAGCVDCPLANEVRCSDGQCYDLTSSVANCGACGKACATTDPHGAEVCINSQCLLQCNPGYDVCAGECVPSLNSNNSNCGACGTACTSLNGTSTCNAGSCVNACSTGYAHCVGPVTVGCETSVLADVNNCGACNNACATVLPNVTVSGVTCNQGECAVSPGGCATGYGDCDGDPRNGCESHASSDVNNCGGCRAPDGGVDCLSLPEVNDGGGVACVTGKCVVSACDTGYTPCGNPAACTQVSVDPSNCGACGAVCALPNVASNGCAAGACTVGTCQGGFADCNGLATDGCETNLGSDNGNCGGCGQSCGTFGTCSGGACTCTYTTCTVPRICTGECRGGYTVCSDLQVDSSNCGTCNNDCGTSAHCNGGTCVSNLIHIL